MANDTMPADYSFASVNDFVHNHDRQFEDLLALCLGMACHIEKMIPSLDAILMPELEKGAYFAYEDDNWWLFAKDGEGIACGKTISKLLTNLIFVKC